MNCILILELLCVTLAVETISSIASGCESPFKYVCRVHPSMIAWCVDRRPDIATDTSTVWKVLTLIAMPFVRVAFVTSPPNLA